MYPKILNLKFLMSHETIVVLIVVEGESSIELASERILNSGVEKKIIMRKPPPSTKCH